MVAAVGAGGADPGVAPAVEMAPWPASTRAKLTNALLIEGSLRAMARGEAKRPLSV